MNRTRPWFIAALALFALTAGGFAASGSVWVIPDPIPPPPESGLTLSKIPVTEPDRTPSRLLIPKLGIDIPVQSVGLDAKGKMGVPDNYTDAGWFRFGPEPGDLGNAVIAAHFTDKAGRPAAFGNLSELEPGDLIHVETLSGRVTFRVSERRSYDVATAPLEEIFGPHSGARLNLITCAGEWQKDVRSYSHRLVVFSELEGDAHAVLP